MNKLIEKLSKLEKEYGELAYVELFQDGSGCVVGGGYGPHQYIKEWNNWEEFEEFLNS